MFVIIGICGFDICIIGNPVFFFFSLNGAWSQKLYLFCFADFPPSFCLSLMVQAKFCILTIDFTYRSISHLRWHLSTGVLHSDNWWGSVIPGTGLFVFQLKLIHLEALLNLCQLAAKQSMWSVFQFEASGEQSRVHTCLFLTLVRRPEELNWACSCEGIQLPLEADTESFMLSVKNRGMSWKISQLLFI